MPAAVSVPVLSRSRSRTRAPLTGAHPRRRVWYCRCPLVRGEERERSPTVAHTEEVFAADLLSESFGTPIAWKDHTASALEAEGRKLLRLYLEAHGHLPVVVTEQPFEVDLVTADGEVLPRKLRGFFDLALADGTVIELKTSSRAWRSADLDKHLQVRAYSYALRARALPLQVHVITSRGPRAPMSSASTPTRTAPPGGSPPRSISSSPS